jgi:hypothetical protein
VNTASLALGLQWADESPSKVLIGWISYCAECALRRFLAIFAAHFPLNRAFRDMPLGVDALLAYITQQLRAPAHL